MVAVASPRILVVIPMLAALAYGLTGSFVGQGMGGHGFVGLTLLVLLGTGVALIGLGLAVLAGERRRRHLPAS
jgi:hypothetical protein